MEDSRIIELYWTRNEDAISRTSEKYSSYCGTIARNILADEGEAEECINDTWLRAWHSMPPERPAALSPFLGRITRNLSLDRLKRRRAARRGGGEPSLALEELEECLPARQDTEQQWEEEQLSALLGRFLRALPVDECNVFLRRYWFCDPLREIAARYHMSEGKVKSMLWRTRNKLRTALEKEEIAL